MTDKVQKIREEVERIQLYTQSEVLKQVLDYIDEVQKEEIPPKFPLISSKEELKQKTFKVEKGKWYVCIKDYHDKNCTFTKGKKYKSDKDGFLVDDEDKDTFERKIWEEDACEYFRPIKCMYTEYNYTDEDRKFLCDGREEECEYAQKKEPISEGRDIFDNCLKSEEKFILPQKISGNIDCENCLYSSACALGDIQECIIEEEVLMSMNFRDKAVFRINRNEVGDCTLELRRHILWVIPYWLTLFTCPIHFSECLDFIRAWCCECNIGTAVIYDPQGANPKMTIKYRRYKGEKLNESV